jgi:hypothetical protein
VTFPYLKATPTDTIARRAATDIAIRRLVTLHSDSLYLSFFDSRLVEGGLEVPLKFWRVGTKCVGTSFVSAAEWLSALQVHLVVAWA